MARAVATDLCNLEFPFHHPLLQQMKVPGIEAMNKIGKIADPVSFLQKQQKPVLPSTLYTSFL